MAEMGYPFDWETHAEEQLQRQEDEKALAEERAKPRETRHPLDERLFAVTDMAAPGNGPYEALLWDADIEQNDLILYLERYWNIRTIIWEGKLLLDLGIEYHDLQKGDYVVLSNGRDLGGFPMPAAEFVRRFVKEE